MSVLVGGEGCDSWGRVERSMERVGERRLLGDEGEGTGETFIAMVAIWSSLMVEVEDELLLAVGALPLLNSVCLEECIKGNSWPTLGYE